MKTPVKPVMTAEVREQLERDVSNAYCDCADKPFSETKHGRNLSFLASIICTRDEAIAVLNQFVTGYNKFKPSLLKHLPENAMVRIAREGSVCMYVELPNDHHQLTEKDAEKMLANEFSEIQVLQDKTVYRLWWD